jgi:hypothetical protein
MATKRGEAGDRVAVVIGPEAEVSVIVGLDKRTTDRLARAEYARLHGVAVRDLRRTGRRPLACRASAPGSPAWSRTKSAAETPEEGPRGRRRA